MRSATPCRPSCRSSRWPRPRSGCLLCFEAPARRWLAHRIPWAATILVNGMIMTIYLWHSTVMMLLVGLAFWQLPAVLAPYPATASWWWTRLLWLPAYALACLPFLLVFSRFERPEKGGRAGAGVAPTPRMRRSPAPGSPPWPWAASAATAGSACAGFPCSYPLLARPSRASVPFRGWCGAFFNRPPWSDDPNHCHPLRRFS